VVIVEEHDRKSLHLMLLKCHNHLHHVKKSKVGYIGQIFYEDYNLNNFKHIANINELVEKLCQNLNDIKWMLNVTFNGGTSMNPYFL